MLEFRCERCGFDVTIVNPYPGQTARHCAECAFIESIQDPEAKKQIAEFFAQRDRRLTTEDEEEN